MKEVQTSKHKMNELPVQDCPTESVAQFDKCISRKFEKTIIYYNNNKLINVIFFF